MKILIVRAFPDILDPRHYNIQEAGLAKAFTRAGHECGIVLYNGKEKDTVETIPVTCDETVRDITVYKLHGFNFFKNGIFPSLKKIVNKYDMIQVHEYDQITSWLYYAWCKKPVAVYHGPYYHPFNKGYNFKCKVFDNTFLKIKRNKNVPCLTKSEAAAQTLKDKGFLDVTPVGVGLDMENLEPVSTEDGKINSTESPYRLLYVGKLEERRNLFFLLEVFRKLLKKDSGFELTIIGNGEKEYKEAFLKKAESLIEEKKLHYMEKMTQIELGGVYQNSHLLVFPSNYEIFGMVLLEAVYYNLPIISSDNGGADMLIRDEENGLIIPQFDSTLWAEKIYYLLREPGVYQNIVKNLQNDDKSRLTWDGIVEKMLNKYQAICEQRTAKKE